MKCTIVFDDWRKVGVDDSIYNTELGVELSLGDFHSGTVFEGEIKLAPEAEKEILDAYKKHGAYPVFRIIAK